MGNFQESIQKFILISLVLLKISCQLENKSLKVDKSSYLHQIENSIVGPQDVSQEYNYMEKCALLKCSSGCCEGGLEEMTCGSLENCEYYISKQNLLKFIYGALISVVCLLTILLMLSGAFAKSHPECSRKILKFIGIFFSVIFFPVAILLWLIKVKCDKASEIKFYKGEPQIDPKESSIKLEIKKLDLIKILNKEDEDYLDTKRTQDTDNVVKTT